MMKTSQRLPKTLLVALSAALMVCLVLGLLAARSGHLTFKPPVAHQAEFAASDRSLYPAPLHASDNRLLTIDGGAVVLRGLMVVEPTRLDGSRRLRRDFFQEIRRTGANAVRIPVHPEYWVSDADYLWRYLDPIVRWSGEAGMYVVIDWHYIGNIVTGEGPEMPDIAQKPRDLSLAFWQQTARYFRNAPHVIFEVFNEPASIGASDWRRSATELVGVVRAQGASQLVVVGGVDYSRDLSWVASGPIADPNLAYAAHIYPSHTAGGWSTWFGEIARTYPVIITEWGFMDENRKASLAYLAGDRAGYGEPFMAYLQERGIGWLACWYDDAWEPAMFQAGGKNRTRWGDFVLEQLAAGREAVAVPTSSPPAVS